MSRTAKKGKITSHSLVEEYAINPVPKAQRNKSWLDLFLIYSGLNISILAFLFGGILIPGLSWEEVLLVAIVGNGLVAVLMTLIGHIGVDQGLPSTIFSRIFLGHPVGTKFCSLVLLISLTGWFAVQAEVERRHHLVLAFHARVDVDERAQPVQSQRRQPGIAI